MNKYIIFQPDTRSDIYQEWQQCLIKITRTRLQGFRLSKLSIYTAQTDYSVWISIVREIASSITNTFGDESPAFNVTIHPPENWNVIAEACYLNVETSTVVTKFFRSIPYVVRISKGWKEVLGAGLGTNAYSYETTQSAKKAFSQMLAVLSQEDMSFNHIVRQWNYIGSILDNDNYTQNYQNFNRIRVENYKKYRTISGYPAATGVGMKYGGFKMDFFAIKTEEHERITIIDNYDQHKPDAYDQQVLEGKDPPLFERAVLLNREHSSTLFISGTASIIGQDVYGIGDIEKQTITSIENINKLINAKELANLKINGNLTFEIILLRVYIKKQDDFNKVKLICNRYFPGVPSVYIEADICRHDLLVEIEAELSGFCPG
jgi:hypothetical protein